MLKTNGKRVIKNLEPAVVTRYATVCNEFGKLEKEKKALRDDIVLKLRGKHPKFPMTRFVSPADCPFMLELTYQKKSQMDWQDFAFKLLVKAYEEKGLKTAEAEQEATKHMARVKERAGYKRNPMLLPPKANQDWLVAQATKGHSAAA